MRKLYCGGTFDFDYRYEGYAQAAETDYRAALLGGAGPLLRRSVSVKLADELEYIGPFYFECPDMTDADIVGAEVDMVERCTDAIFLMDGAACPGTVCELTSAAMLGKRLYIFYVRRPDSDETESALHTPCWYPIVFSRIKNSRVELHEYHNIDDAKRGIIELVEKMKASPEE